MSTWQTVMTIIATIYALMILYVAYTAARDWGTIESSQPLAQYCPPGSRCQLCGDARQTEDRDQGSTAPRSIGQSGG
jgi:hypothetical protein